MLSTCSFDTFAEAIAPAVHVIISVFALLFVQILIDMH